MGYSDEPLSEHSLTGTRNRPHYQETQQGPGRVGREVRRHGCVTTVGADKQVWSSVHKFRRTTKPTHLSQQMSEQVTNITPVP